MVADQEIDTGGMKLITSGDLLDGSRMPSTDCRGKGMLRPSSNK